MKNSDLKKELKKSLLMLGLASSLTLGTGKDSYAATITKVESSKITNETSKKSMNADEIYVFDSKDMFNEYNIDKTKSGIYNESRYGGGNKDINTGEIFYMYPEKYQDYYFFKKLKESPMRTAILSEKYENIFNSAEKAWYSYNIETCYNEFTIPWGYLTDLHKGNMYEINEFLKLNDAEELSQDTYTEQDLLKIQNYMVNSEEKSDIYVFDAKYLFECEKINKDEPYQDRDLNYLYPENYQDYYFMTKTYDKKEDDGSYEIVYKDIFGENTITQKLDKKNQSFSCTFPGGTMDIFFSQYSIISMSQFLNRMNLNDLQKDRYTKEELSEIMNYLTTQSKVKTRERN